MTEGIKIIYDPRGQVNTFKTDRGIAEKNMKENLLPHFS